MKKLPLLICFVLSIIFCQAQNQKCATDTLATDTSIQTMSQPALNSAAAEEEWKEVIKEESDSNTTEDLEGMISGIIFFVLCGFIVYICLYFNHKKKVAKYKIIEKAIEQGIELPSNFFTKEKKESNYTTLEEGIITMAVGIALFVASFVSYDRVPFMMVGIIITTIGAGLLTIAFLRLKTKKKADIAESKTSNEE